MKSHEKKNPANVLLKLLEVHKNRYRYRKIHDYKVLQKTQKQQKNVPTIE